MAAKGSELQGGSIRLRNPRCWTQGLNLGAGCRRLPAELSCHGWTRARTSSLLIFLVQRALQGDGRASPIPREGNRDLPIAPATWLLPLLAVEQAGSSEVTKTESCWELGLMNRTMVSYVSSELLSVPPTSFSPHQSGSVKGLLVYLLLQSCLFPAWRSKWNHRIWMQDGNRQSLVMSVQLQHVLQCLFLRYRRILTKLSH